jgi:hypothetical protein
MRSYTPWHPYPGTRGRTGSGAGNTGTTAMRVDGDARREWINENIEGFAYLADGFDEAIVGISERFGRDPIVSYDRDKCIEILAKEFAQDNDDPELDATEEAEDYFAFNVIGGWVGEGTPEFITLYREQE